MKPIIQSVKGTRDFYPEDMAARNFLYQTVRKISEAYGYQEYEAPFLETIDLYAAKSGEELVKEQAFVFPDRGGDLITLRPELTPSLARMVAQRQRQLVYPMRWWSWGPFWRYERPQKGRTREFFQWNADLMGVDTPEADAELVALAAGFLQASGLTPDQVSILVNNRRLVNGELQELGIPAELRTEVFRLIDRRDKMTSVEWQAYALNIGLSEAQFEGLKTILEDKDLWRKSGDLVRFFAAIKALGCRAYVRYAPHIIRGLDYYTGTVFEAWDNAGEFRAILGGGRYDNLVGDVGGEPLAGVGFAMGDAVISLILKKFGCFPTELGAPSAQVLVTVFDESSLAASFKFSASLRQAGIQTICYPEAAKLSKQVKFGDRMGLRVVVILGPDELASGKVALKNLRTGEQQTVAEQEAPRIIRLMLD
ncbi:MAG: histidine--tRNA ligase [Anaerolineales bacterium]|nr:histidine--tRNA ligase [Anaerolineales bacterium]